MHEPTAGAARARAAADGIDPHALSEIVRSVLTSLDQKLGSRSLTLLAEVEELARLIGLVKAEVAGFPAGDIGRRQIADANDELDAIVLQTAAATNEILDACEALNVIAPSSDQAVLVEVRAATTRIFEACGFQDIVGQRIGKVVRFLRIIDANVEQIITTLGEVVPDWVPAHRRDDLAAEEGLMNGPQLPSAALSQSEIDRLMAGF